MNASARWCVLIPLAALVICGESALAQTQQQDAERMQREGVERADAAARAQGMEQQRQLQERERQAEESRRSESSSSTGGGYTPPHGGYAPSPSGGNSAGTGSDFGAMGKETLRLPPLPAERNVLLGSWRVEDGGQGGITRLGQAMGAGGTDAMLLDLWSTLESNPGKLLCEPMFGNGITFAPSTYAINALDGSVVRGSIAYRSPKAQVIVATPSNLRDPMIFEIADANRILFRGSCALVRVGAPAAGAAANATTGPGNARTAAKAASANCVVAGVQLGVDTVANVERDIQARGGSPLTGGSGVLGKFRMTAMSGDYQDAGFDPMAVNYDFDASGPDGRLVAVTIANMASAVPDYETLLASRKAAAAAIAGPLQQKSATELVASGPGCQLRLLPNADMSIIYEVYQLPN